VMYDLLIVLALMLVANMLGLAVTGGHLLDDRQHLRAAWFPLFEAGCVGGYFLASWRRGGQTVGMRPWHIRVTARDGGPAPLRRLLIRLLVAAAPLLLLGLTPVIGLHRTMVAMLVAWTAWFALGLLDRRRRALHDIIAGTEVRLLD
jgi:uncharacterized RDD family membrane protein YckC